jgi:hypothetical protein
MKYITMHCDYKFVIIASPSMTVVLLKQQQNRESSTSILFIQHDVGMLIYYYVPMTCSS